MGVRWGVVFGQQDRAGILVLIVAAVGTALAHYANNPQGPTIWVYDAAITKPSMDDTISNGLAAAIAFIAMFVSVLFVEVVLHWHTHSRTSRITAVLQFILGCLTAFAVVLFITEFTKRLVSRPRPDFMTRCEPSAAANSPLSFMEAAVCTSTNTYEIAEGQLSFPSGHSANTLSVAWYSALYIAWSIYIRDGEVLSTFMRGSWWQLVLKDFIDFFVIIYALGLICLSWFVGCSRYKDNRHHISDITGGMILAIIFVTPYFLRVAGKHISSHRIIKELESDKTRPLTLEQNSQFVV